MLVVRINRLTIVWFKARSPFVLKHTTSVCTIICTVCIYVCMHVCMCVYVCVCMFVCMYVCVCVCNWGGSLCVTGLKRAVTYSCA